MEDNTVFKMLNLEFAHPGKFKMIFAQPRIWQNGKCTPWKMAEKSHPQN